MEFGITGSELVKLNKWMKEHDKTCVLKYNQGAIGGRLTYEFTPTGLGVIIKVKCGCGEFVDLTEYEHW